MKKKAAKKVLKIYAVCSLALISCCVCLFVWSGLEKAFYGEFRVLPVLNMAQFVSDDVSGAEADAMLVGAVEYISQLETNGRGWRDPLWRFINISTTAALCNLPLWYLLWVFKARNAPWINKVLLIAGAVAMILIAAVRIYIDNSYGSVAVADRYPIAYITWRDLFFPALVLFLLTCIAKADDPVEIEDEP